MSLPIDAEAIAAQTKAEHEYGERLMDLATERVTYAGRDLITADDIEWAVGTWEHEVRHGESLQSDNCKQQHALDAVSLSNDVQSLPSEIRRCVDIYLKADRHACGYGRPWPTAEDFDWAEREDAKIVRGLQSLRSICAERMGSK